MVLWEILQLVYCVAPCHCSPPENYNHFCGVHNHYIRLLAIHDNLDVPTATMNNHNGFTNRASKLESIKMQDYGRVVKQEGWRKEKDDGELLPCF